MDSPRLFILLLFLASLGCRRAERVILTKPDHISQQSDLSPGSENPDFAGKAALLLTRFKSFEELKSVIQIEYFKDAHVSSPGVQGNNLVRLTHRSAGREVMSTLKPGISEADFLAAKRGGLKDRIFLGLSSPYSVMNRGDLLSVEILARRRHAIFGEGDVAFYDLAETMVFNINDDDLIIMPSADLSEKGYLNTFNHITAQAFMTTLFSENLADFIADIHERYHMPELVTGEFTEDQIADLEEGPVDNYIDIINNEWGQELGKLLSAKYNINRKTNWTPELLANYLNDIQNYNSWAFQIGFKPFKNTDEVVIRFSIKINKVLNDGFSLSRYYY